MMKRHTKTWLAALFTLAGLGLSACKDYLNEELVSTLTYDYYNTEQGLQDLVKSAYEPTRAKFEGEQGYTLFNFGTDEFTHGDQVNFVYYNTYDARLNPNNGIDNFENDFWSRCYQGINRCNTGLELIPKIAGTTTLATDVQKTQRLAELHFLRGLYYFELVQQFGAIPLVLKSSEGVQLEFPRTDVPTIYRTIVSDLRFAAANLTPTNTEFGRATRGAAQHFLAKVYLTRGSAVTDVRGQQPTDMDSAAYYADQVINSGTFQLETDFGKLWDISNYSNSRAAQTSKEIIFAAQFNNVLTLAGALGNTMHLYYSIQYDVNVPGMTRDVAGGRPYRRLMPTNYAMDIFDRKNDSRFYKSIKTAYYSNTASSIPKWTAADAPTPAQVGQPKFAVGDTAMYIIVNTPQTALTNAQVTKSRYLIAARYYRTASGALASYYSPTGDVGVRSRFPSLVKFLDPFRANVNETRGTRDGILARLGETYLIAAEAYGRKGDYGKAVTYINTLRQRAAYKAGEPKPSQFWKVEGGSKNDAGSTYPALQITTAKFSTNDPAEMYPASVSSEKDRFIHFILNERTRELLGELYRWEDLVRTETVLLRAPYHNPDAKNIQPFHKLRPIPQQHLERVFRDGKPLTSDERQAEQNPGY
jgi:hypothetical protein